MRTALIIIILAAFCAIICGTVAYYSPEACTQRELQRNLEMKAEVMADPAYRKETLDAIDSLKKMEAQLDEEIKNGSPEGRSPYHRDSKLEEAEAKVLDTLRIK